jgi:hypothetical protein
MQSNQSIQSVVRQILASLCVVAFVVVIVGGCGKKEEPAPPAPPPPASPSGTVIIPLDAFMRGATADLAVKTQTQEAQWQISRCLWNANLDTGVITFRSPTGIIATGPVQVIGTYNTTEQVWLWSWGNQSFKPAVTQHAQKLRDLGQQHKIEVFTTPAVKIPEQGCWQLSAAVFHLNGDQGVHAGPATPDSPLIVFLAFGPLQFTQGPPPTQPSTQMSEPPATQATAPLMLPPTTQAITLAPTTQAIAPLPPTTAPLVPTSPLRTAPTTQTRP